MCNRILTQNADHLANKLWAYPGTHGTWPISLQWKTVSCHIRSKNTHFFIIFWLIQQSKYIYFNKLIKLFNQTEEEEVCRQKEKGEFVTRAGRRWDALCSISIFLPRVTHLEVWIELWRFWFLSEDIVRPLLRSSRITCALLIVRGLWENSVRRR